MARTAVSKMTSKGQVTVPEAIREELHLEEGDRLEWQTTDEGTAVVRKTGRPLEQLVGLLGKPSRGASIAALDEGIRAHARRAGRARR